MVRRVPLKQHTPEGSAGPFTVVVDCPGDTYWHVRIVDAIVGDEPEFRYVAPKRSKFPPFTVQEIANAGAGHLNEARGLVEVVEFIDGNPTFSSLFASNGRQVFCVWSTDPARAAPVDLSFLRATKMPVRPAPAVAVHG
jgi:hypothetical protein